MSGPYRPLFHELSDDVFALAKGILEEALRKAQPNQRYSPPSNASLFNQLMESSAAHLICERFGWQSATMYREVAFRSTTLVAKLDCGHRAEISLTDYLVETTPSIVGLLNSLGQRTHHARRCYCVPRAP